MNADEIDRCFARLLADDAGARAALIACRCAALDRGDTATAGLASAGTMLATAAEFSDFRGLGPALACFAAAAAVPLVLQRSIDRARFDAAMLAWPSLDHAVGHDAPSVQAARDRLHEALRAGDDLAADERVLLAKVLIDHAGMCNDVQGVERMIALLQSHATAPAVSAAWRGRWWLLVAINAEYFGRMAAAQEARRQALALAERHGLTALRHELLCVEMQISLREHDLNRAERVFGQIEQMRPHVPAGRVPQGLRAQASLQALRGEYGAALERIDLLLALCRDLEVPERDCGAYWVQRSYCLTGLNRHDEALAQLHALRPQQKAGQGELLEAIIAMSSAARAVALGHDEARTLAADALRRCARVALSRFLMPLPDLAAKVAAIGLDEGVEREFVCAAIRERSLLPPDPHREHWPWRLQVYVLGELRVLCDGMPLAGAAAKAHRKPLELLAVLAAHGGGPVEAQALINHLWPSLEAHAPKASLEMNVSRLRKLLALPGAVLVENGSVRLNPSLVWTDVGAFKAAAAAAERGDVAAADMALALYRNRLFGNEETVGLVKAARESLARRLDRLLLDRGAQLEAQGDWAAASRIYELGIRLAPLAEPVYRALMRMQLQRGERAEALRTFRHCSEVLQALLGTTPAGETLALYLAALEV